MNRLTMTSTVGTDGVLHLAVPVGLDEANREVQVTVESGSSKPTLTPSECPACRSKIGNNNTR